MHVSTDADGIECGNAGGTEGEHGMIQFMERNAAMKRDRQRHATRIGPGMDMWTKRNAYWMCTDVKRRDGSALLLCRFVLCSTRSAPSHRRHRMA